MSFWKVNYLDTHSNSIRIIPSQLNYASSVADFRFPLQQIIKHVVVAFALVLVEDTRGFEQVVDDSCARNVVFGIEIDLDPFTESRAVVIPRGLCVSKGLQDGVRVENSSLDSTRRPAHLGDVGEHGFR
jgi:hypothetical protein